MKINLIVIALLIVLLFAAGFYLINLTKKSANDCETQPIDETNIKNHETFALHIHPQIKISILEEDKTIPANIGLSDDIIRAIHTHDFTGKLHIESPCLREFRLKDFFKIWGENFNSTCIFDFCVNENNSLKMYVNSRENYEFENLILRDQDKIEIIYK